MFRATEDALSALTEMRELEGSALRRDFSARIAKLTDIIDSQLAGTSEKIVAEYRERLNKVLTDVCGEDTGIDAARLVQEVALYADRSDFTEEVVRLKSHLSQFGTVIDETNKTEPVGRKLDFLLQEINREVNTIGSKANNASAREICVELKSEIEKLREQVQNIE